MRDAHEYIEQYLKGELAGQELEKFNLELNRDPSLAREVEEQLRVKNLLQYLGNRRTHDKLLQVEQKLEHEGFFDEQKTDKVKPRRIRRLILNGGMSIAASLLLLIWFTNPNYDRIVIKATNKTEPITSKVIENAKSESGYARYNPCLEDLDIKQWLIIKKCLIENPDDSPVHNFLLGFTYFKEGELNEAEVYLKKIDIDNDFYDPARWYLALIYIMQDKKASAYTILNHLIERESLYTEHAKVLLKKIQ